MKRIKLVSSAAGDSGDEAGYGHMIHSYPLSATQLQIKLALIRHWKVIVPDLKKSEWWHKPQQIKEACVPDPARLQRGSRN